MKKIIVFPLFLILLLTQAVFSQQPPTPGEKKGWSKEEKLEFINSCIGTAKEGMSVDSARHYCMCMQEKIEAKYPVAEDAAKLTSEDLNSPEWKREIQNCLAGHWSDKDRSAFLGSCIDVAKGGMSESKAKSYCECMLYKVEKKFPDSADAAKLTGEELAKPEWKKAVQDCMQ